MDIGTEYYHRFLQGDTNALEELVREYGDALTRYAFCYVKDAAAAEDIMADTFAILIVKRKQFKEGAKFRTYLYKIARNKSIDYLRAHARNLPLNDLENVLQSKETENDYFRKERNRELFICMQALSPQYRDVLYLVYFNGFDVREVCRVMRKNTKQVYNLLARAKSSLKEILIKEGFSYEFL